MCPWSAKIIRDRTADGIFILTPEAPWKVGQEVEVDLDSRRKEQFQQDGSTEILTVEIIYLLQPQPNNQIMYFPTEMLEL